jgi:hypothetical protein
MPDYIKEDFEDEAPLRPSKKDSNDSIFMKSENAFGNHLL